MSSEARPRILGHANSARRRRSPSRIAARLAALVALVLTAAVAMPASAAADPNQPIQVEVPSGQDVQAIPGSYIVRVRAGADPAAIASSLGVQPRFVYRAALNGFAGDLTPNQLQALQVHADVEAISQSVAVLDPRDDTTQVAPPTWGLDRIDQRFLPLAASYQYGYTGAGVRVYVIDSGIDTTHPDFEGRAQFMHNSVNTNNTDCEGHGTHVAGTVGSKTYGVAKKVFLRAVKVLDCVDPTTTPMLIDAVEWVTANAIHPAVANTSWNSPNDTNLSTALTNMMNSGVYLAASAGNTGADSCDRLPRRLAAAMVVANVSGDDIRWPTSSVGACVDLYAPGTNIRSTLVGGGNGTMTGTSMATPHAAGLAALYKDAYPDTSQSVINGWIRGCATPGVLTVPATTPNLLLNTCGL